MKTKILYLTTTLEKGGTETQLYYLLSELSKDKNYDIKLISLEGGIYEKKIQELGISVRVLSKKVAYRHLLSYLGKIRKEIGGFEPHIVHSCLFHTNILAKFLALYEKNYLLVCAYRNIISPYPLLKKAEFLFRKQADCLLSNSFSVQENILEEGFEKEKTRVLPNMYVPKKIDSARLRDLKKKYGGKKLILTVAHFRAQKDYRTNVASCAQILETEDNLLVLYIGEGETLQECREEVRRLGLQKKILFLGKREDVAEHLLCADVFFLPTLFEGMPNAVMEAMYYKVPIVASDIKPIRELNAQAFLCPPQNVSSFVHALKTVLHKALSDAELENNKKLIEEKYSLKKIVEGHKSLYKKLLSGSLQGGYSKGETKV